MHPEPPLNLNPLLRRLVEQDVPFVVIGGIAAILHGVIYTTTDLDICAPVATDEMQKLWRAIADLEPRARFHPQKIPIRQDFVESPRLRNLNLQTTLGSLDVLGEVEGIGNYEAVQAASMHTVVDGMTLRMLNLDSLITAKTAAGRLKDKLTVYQLLALRKEQHKQRESS